MDEAAATLGSGGNASDNVIAGRALKLSM